MHLYIYIYIYIYSILINIIIIIVIVIVIVINVVTRRAAQVDMLRAGMVTPGHHISRTFNGPRPGSQFWCMASGKRQAASGKRQAASGKLQLFAFNGQR